MIPGRCRWLASCNGSTSSGGKEDIRVAYIRGAVDDVVSKVSEHLVLHSNKSMLISGGRAAQRQHKDENSSR